MDHDRRGVLKKVLALGAVSLAGACSGSRAAQAQATLTPAQLAGQRVVFSYRGLTVPATLLKQIRAGQAAGVIFFGGNISNEAQIASVIKQLRRAQQQSPVSAPLLLMTDQEGGYVKRLPGAPDHSEKWIGQRPTASDRAYQARKAGSGTASNLLSYGLNVNLAPVLDVYRAAGDFDDQYQRSYSMNSRVVSALGTDFIAAQQGGGVAATAKHFPGLGAATASQNTDETAVTIRLSKATLQNVDEYPYRAAISAGVDLVMVSWAKYPHLGSGRPAGLASAIVQGQLRGRLHFKGVTITDAIGAGALAPYGSTQNRTLLAAEAGMQLILAASQSPTAGLQCLDALENGYHNGKLGSAAFQATVEQVLQLRARLHP